MTNKILTLGLLASATFTQVTQASDADLKTIENLGWFMSQNVSQLELNEAETGAFKKGFVAGIDGEEGPEDKQAADTAIREYLNDRMAGIQARKSAELAEKSKTFFSDLEKNPNVKKSESGLYYEIIEAGEDVRATRNDSVTVHYTGTLVDGTVFDSSHERGQPATFPVSGVVPGFGEGVQLIGVGGKVKLYIKPELGYGERAAGSIPPGSTLVFEVDMIDIEKAATEAAE